MRDRFGRPSSPSRPAPLTARDVLERLPSADKSSDVDALLVGLGGELDALLELHRDLGAEPVEGRWSSYVRGEVERSCGTSPDPGAPESLVTLAEADPAAVPRLADLAADGQSVERLALLAASRPIEGPRLELIAAWMHEAVNRRAQLDDEPSLRAVQATLAERGHPLLWLPLSLTRVESEPSSTSPSADWKPLPPGDASAARAELDRERFHDRHDGKPILDLPSPAKAYETWVKRSNGWVDVVRLQGTPGEGPTTAAMDALGMMSSGSLRAAVEVPPDEAFDMLFVAASVGGAYDGGLKGAWGRRAAWIALGALAGAEPPPISSAEDAVLACRWVRFTTYAEDPSLLDEGLAAFRPDGTIVAVAATDSD